MRGLWRIAGGALAVALLAVPLVAQGSCGESSKPIVVGFVGGFVRVSDHRHGEVVLADQLRAEFGSRARIGLFRNRDGEAAHKAILGWLERGGDGSLSADARRCTPIILYGHSWGAWALVRLARMLEADGVPVRLTIQVDSVQKSHKSDDGTIPSNVGEAVNFYQRAGILHGRAEIHAADAGRTQILGNYRMDYAQAPACSQHYPWQERLLSPGHNSIGCDPEVWGRVRKLIEERMPR
jgi:hypothetical protein